VSSSPVNKRFEFATATRVIFGEGVLGEIGPIARELGRRALVVAGRDLGRAQRLGELLRAERLGVGLFSIPGEPHVATVRQCVAMARTAERDLVISLGGGSAIDAGKAIAALMTNEGDVLDYLEVIGRGKALTRPSAPFIAIPTTAGTGSEVTRNAVLASPEHRVKVSLRSPFMLAKVALVDPELAYGLPPAITASTGLDALTQLIEPFVCARSNPMVDALCVDGIRRAAPSLRAVFQNGRDVAARRDMALASLFSGMALANAGLGAVHGLAAVIGGSFDAPHGAICAILLPQVMETNLRALRERDPGGEGLRRYEVVAHLLTGNAHATADDGVEWVRRLVCDMKIPALGVWRLRVEDIAEVVDKSLNASSMKANPIVLTRQELAGVLERVLY
jgi:alcohol dehydrogenase class IV